MGQGVDAVIQAIAQQFGSVEIRERYNVNTKGTILDFSSEARFFGVEVTREYDDDYAFGQVKTELGKLAHLIRGSQGGKAVVMRSGILTVTPMPEGQKAQPKSKK